MSILLVEDEIHITSFVKPELEHEGYTVLCAENGRQAVDIFEQIQNTPQKIDLVLLDIMIPELNGLEVLRRIRKTSEVPVILVSARGETFDKVNGLDLGADDYIAKPFAIEELLARIRSALRRQNTSEKTIVKETAEILIFEDLCLDPLKVEVTMRGNKIILTKTEFMLLQCLMLHKNQVLSRDEIISHVWGKEHYIDENSVDVYIRYLRAKIDDKFNVKYIFTIRGSGYTMKNG